MSEKPIESPMGMRLLRISLAVLSLIAWVVFLLVDSAYHQAIVSTAGTYGEMYGPLSFFHPVIKWIALTATACLCAVELFDRR